MNQQTMGVSRSLIAFVVLAVLCFLAYAFLTMPDQRSWTDRVGDAFHAAPQGIGKASEQLQDRTPGQKLGDTIKDNTAPQ